MRRKVQRGLCSHWRRTREEVGGWGSGPPRDCSRNPRWKHPQLRRGLHSQHPRRRNQRSQDPRRRNCLLRTRPRRNQMKGNPINRPHARTILTTDANAHARNRRRRAQLHTRRSLHPPNLRSSRRRAGRGGGTVKSWPSRLLTIKGHRADDWSGQVPRERLVY
jgi:hypothetical protein